MMNAQRRNHLALAVRVSVAACLLAISAHDSAVAQTLPDLVARAKPSVLLVGTNAEVDNPRFTFRGTGFVVGDGNRAITNVHVLPEPDALAGAGGLRELVVQARNGDGSWSIRAAQVIAMDRPHDLALLKFEGPAVPPLELAAKGRAREGAEIAIMGFPLGGALGFSTVTHHGILAAITGIALPPPNARALNEHAIRQLRDGSFDIYQLDATAYPGNSGGPMFDVQTGEVLGIINMVLVKGSKETALSQPSGISYAIPAYFAAELLRNP
ncbi:MAG TPA: serine protease [Burkholderiaceae bacterium]|jgi:S1-C subfamily serine protease